MVNLIDIILYILKYYPHKNELSNARLTKMIYLADWRSAYDYGTQITNIRWYFDNYGPFVHDVEQVIEENSDKILTLTTRTIFGNKKILYRLRDENIRIELPQNITQVIDTIIQVTQGLYWDQFINFVYSTYPIVTSERYTYLDLLNKANIYRRQLNGEI